MQAKEKDLNYWHENASEDFVHTPICVLRYIHELESSNKQLQEEVESLKEELKLEKSHVSAKEWCMKHDEEEN